ncbi:MAG: hypothetical protein IID44_03345 [Planctomycetes bacterium]|nr:hypothetical protein [Planctomycetota bacterium]
MTQIVVNPATAEKLSGIQTTVELCDPSGNLLGYFSPKVNPSLYDQVEPPISEEELDRIEKEGGGRPLRDVLDDLEKKHG